MIKRLLYALLILTIGLATSCTEDEKDMRGSIYGIVTDSKTAEPMRAVGVELYKYSSLLLKTVTYDDGHFEFENLEPGDYKLKVVAEGYTETEYSVLVEGGRTARADMQVSKLQTYLTVRTLDVTEPKGGVITFNGSYTYKQSYSYVPDEVGFIYGNTKSINLNEGTNIKAQKSDRFECTVKIQDLTNGTWYVMAYAKNKVGYEFGEVRQFEVNLVPQVKTLAATNIEETTATLNGQIVYEGKPKYTEKGFVYSSSFPTPSIDDPENATTTVSISGDSKEFSSNIANLTKNKIYYVRAYAKNSDVVVYGDAVSFTPHSDMPEVKTLEATNIESPSATLNGLIVLEGKPKYTEKGFVYSSSYNLPAIDDPETVTSKVSVAGSGKEFSANVSDLKGGKTYYVRAYAKCNDGIVYGETISFEATNQQYIIIGNLAIQKTDISSLATWKQAKELCQNSRVAGFSDWRLPTLTELLLMYENRFNIGGFQSEYMSSPYYWSSGSNYEGNYYAVSFYNGSQSTFTPTKTLKVRAVRTVN